MFDARVIQSGPGEGAWNMAFDEVLAHQAAATGLSYLRFYEWREPTLSLGYFQRLESRREHSSSFDCSVVRRASGGGAIVHHHELTYSLALPGRHPLARAAQALYLAVHNSLLEALQGFGVQAALQPGIANAGPAGEPFLCFERRAAGDVLFHGAKIAGSAQRRLRGAILQHGSILLAQSEFAPTLPGIRELSGVSLRPTDFSAAWQPILLKGLSLRLLDGAAGADLLLAAKQLAAAKFGSEAWTRLK